MTAVEAVEVSFNSFENDYSAKKNKKKMLSDLSLVQSFLLRVFE
jgi:hypothetical protein